MNRGSIYGIVEKYIMKDIVIKGDLLIFGLHTCGDIMNVMEKVTLINLIGLKCELQIIQVTVGGKNILIGFNR